MSAFEQVISAPHSVAAREALLDEWRQQQHPQARLLELQLKQYRGLGMNEWQLVPLEVQRILKEHGNEWATALSPHLRGHWFGLGLVAGAGITGDAFVEYGSALALRAPIVRLTITTPPIDMARFSTVTTLAQMRFLAFVSLDDAGVEQLARSQHLRELRALYVRRCSLTRVGLDRLTTMDLPNLIYMDVTGNPGVAAYNRRFSKLGDDVYILGESGERLMDDALAAAIFDYSRRPAWPPLESTYLFDNDE